MSTTPLHQLLALKQVVAKQAAEVAQQVNTVNRSTPPFIDIDIGTAGIPMQSKVHLVTFDPFDLPITKHNYERHAFAISPLREGNATFYVNHARAGCSSLLPINPAFSAAAEAQEGVNKTYLADCLPENGCHLAPECNACKTCSTLKHHTDHFFHVAVLQCRRPPHGFDERVIPTMRLSSFLRSRGVQRVGFLKVDAQGADLSIIEDVFTRTDVPIDHLRVECQMLDRAPPMYVHGGFLPNDCFAAIEMVRRHRPALAKRIEWGGSNCHIAEYNLDFWM